ncbi:MAG: 3-phosphoshikimate 1-carboxyvinyltransferase [Lachnospiraceae bacterium]|nr:3-phosphoshikimate 1-carboxyvinyltransferase [Lachnospiraceae bacterium]
MNTITLHKAHSLRGEITVPGDKSISHRAVMFGSIAKGTTRITGFLDGADCRSTIGCFLRLGIGITQDGDHVTVCGRGLHGLSEPKETLDVGNSGTTMRLICGILSAQPFVSHLTGDTSIQKRPMQRIMAPLRRMGAAITSDNDNNCAPLTIRGGKITGTLYHSPVASAQVKSCILLAGLYGDRPTTVIEPSLSRDHTERMLTAFGADITSIGASAKVIPCEELFAQDIEVCGDISSAAYWIAAGLIAPDSELLIKNVNTNPTRAGILSAAKKMGGQIDILNKRTVSGEDVADLLVRSSSLHGIRVEGPIIPTLIDELPVIAVMGAYADGETVIADAAELKVKESDRIASVTDNLSAMGADITATEDGMIIRGGKPLHGAAIHTQKDHRIAMAFAVAALSAEGDTVLNDADCVNISYPGFYETLSGCIGR